MDAFTEQLVAPLVVTLQGVKLFDMLVVTPLHSCDRPFTHLI